MTSWKGRINTTGAVINQFMEYQTFKPDVFFLWLSTAEFPNQEEDLPNSLISVIRKFKIQVKWQSANEYCCKRWNVFPEHFDDYVLSIDDDSLHSQHLIEDCIAELDKLKSNGLLRCACNVWWQFSAIPTYANDIKIKFKYTSDVPSQKIWLCATCMYAPQSFPLEALNSNVVKFRDTNLPKNDEAWLIPYALKAETQITFVHRNYSYVPIANEAETSLSKYNGKTIDQFGYSNTEKALYKMLKFSGMLNIYKQLHPKYSEERYELCQIQ